MEQGKETQSCDGKQFIRVSFFINQISDCTAVGEFFFPLLPPQPLEIMVCMSVQAAYYITSIFKDFCWRTKWDCVSLWFQRDNSLMNFHLKDERFRASLNGGDSIRHNARQALNNCNQRWAKKNIEENHLKLSQTISNGFLIVWACFLVLSHLCLPVHLLCVWTGLVAKPQQAALIGLLHAWPHWY